MAIQHIVFSKFKASVASDDQTKAFEIAKGLLAIIPQVKSAAVGPPINPKLARGYTYAMTATFDNLEAFNAYLKHPKHIELIKALSPFTEGMIAYQIETGPVNAKL